VATARTLEELSQAEAAWWDRLEADAESAASLASLGPAAVVSTVALLAVDARRVRAALTLAARGGTPLEAFDAVV
jgi:hypothetical protein